MSAENGKPNGASRILSLDGARKPKDKGSDLATKQDVANIIAAEVSKVHEYYLNQIPAFTARMIQDALIAYGLISVQPGPDGTPIVAASETVVGHVTTDGAGTIGVVPVGEPVPEGQAIVSDVVATLPETPSGDTSTADTTTVPTESEGPES